MNESGGKDFVWNTIWQSVTVAFIYFGALVLKQCHGYKPFLMHTGHLEQAHQKQCLHRLQMAKYQTNLNVFEIHPISNGIVKPQEVPRKFGLQIVLIKSLTTYKSVSIINSKINT